MTASNALYNLVATGKQTENNTKFVKLDKFAHTMKTRHTRVQN